MKKDRKTLSHGLSILRQIFFKIRNGLLSNTKQSIMVPFYQVKIFISAWNNFATGLVTAA